jgi:hypothetical protein
MQLSVLIVSVSDRLNSLQKLLNNLNEQKTKAGFENRCEVLCLLDDKSMSIGMKRSILLQHARGEFFTFIDDDNVTEHYLTTLLSAIDEDSSIDVIAFKQLCSFPDGTPCFVVDADMNNGVDEYIPFMGPWKNEYKRLCWHWCVFRTSVCRDVSFDDVSMYEDQLWLIKVRQCLKRQFKINRVLHLYCFMNSDSQSLKG